LIANGIVHLILKTNEVFISSEKKRKQHFPKFEQSTTTMAAWARERGFEVWGQVSRPYKIQQAAASLGQELLHS